MTPDEAKADMDKREHSSAAAMEAVVDGLTKYEDAIADQRWSDLFAMRPALLALIGTYGRACAHEALQVATMASVVAP